MCVRVWYAGVPLPSAIRYRYRSSLKTNYLSRVTRGSGENAVVVVVRYYAHYALTTHKHRDRGEPGCTSLYVHTYVYVKRFIFVRIPKIDQRMYGKFSSVFPSPSICWGSKNVSRASSEGESRRVELQNTLKYAEKERGIHLAFRVLNCLSRKIAIASCSSLCSYLFKLSHNLK